jgi:hypothetical protein
MFISILALTVCLVKGTAPSRKQLEAVAFKIIADHKNVKHELWRNDESLAALQVMADEDSWDPMMVQDFPFPKTFAAISKALYEEHWLAIDGKTIAVFSAFRAKLEQTFLWGLLYAKLPEEIERLLTTISLQSFPDGECVHSVELFKTLSREMKATTLFVYQEFVNEFGQHVFEDLRASVDRLEAIAHSALAPDLTKDDAGALKTEILRIIDVYGLFASTMKPTIDTLDKTLFVPIEESMSTVSKAKKVLRIPFRSAKVEEKLVVPVRVHFFHPPLREDLEAIALKTVEQVSGLLVSLAVNTEAVKALTEIASCQTDYITEVVSKSPFPSTFEDIKEAVCDEKTLIITDQTVSDFERLAHRMEEISVGGLLYGKDPNDIHELFDGETMRSKVFKEWGLRILSLMMVSTAITAYVEAFQRLGSSHFGDLVGAVDRFESIGRTVAIDQISKDEAARLKFELLALTAQYPLFLDVMKPAIDVLDQMSPEPKRKLSLFESTRKRMEKLFGQIDNGSDII